MTTTYQTADELIAEGILLLSKKTKLVDVQNLVQALMSIILTFTVLLVILGNSASKMFVIVFGIGVLIADITVKILVANVSKQLSENFHKALSLNTTQIKEAIKRIKNI